MRSLFKKPEPIYGIEIPPRRFTPWAVLYFLMFFCLPVLGLSLALDIVLYLVFTRVFDTCYALLCLLD